MTRTLQIDGKKLHPIKDVVKEVSYSRDHVTKLARDKKIVAAHIGRHWYVDLDSLLNYQRFSEQELEIRKNNLRLERKREQKIELTKKNRQKIHEQKAKKIKVRAVATTAVVLSFSLMSGWSSYYLVSGEGFSNKNIINIAQVEESRPEPATPTSKVASVYESHGKNTGAKKVINPLSDDVQSGILLLPQGSLKATTTDLFSDEVMVLTSDEGIKTVVKVNEEGEPTGRVIPFVEVPVKESSK